MFCISCGAKADEGDKFCLKCGKPIVAPPDAAPAYTEQPKTTDPYAPSDAVPTYTAPPKTSDPYAPPAYNAEPKTSDPYAPPAYNAQPYHAPQSASQEAKPVSGRKGNLTPVIIASVAVVAVALIAAVLFFALGSGTKDQSDNEGPGDSMSDTEEAGLNADDDIDSEPDSEPEPEPADSPPPEEDEEDAVDEEDAAGDDFMLNEDGSGFIFRGLEFKYLEVDLNPMFAPAYMPSGHEPFIVSFTIKYTPDADEIMSLLYSVGYFMIGNEKAEFGAALLGDEKENQSIYSLVSSCTRINDSSPITLYIGDNAFIVR